MQPCKIDGDRTAFWKHFVDLAVPSLGGNCMYVRGYALIGGWQQQQESNEVCCMGWVVLGYLQMPLFWDPQAAVQLAHNVALVLPDTQSEQ